MSEFSRQRAFFLHLLMSAVLAVAGLAVVFLLWYPKPLHEAVGVTSIFLLLLGVDVVLGPCLTWVVFKPGKKTLALDLTIIIAVQLLAFGYGIHTMAEGRPAWLVLNTDRFDLVRALDVDERKLDAARPEYRSSPWMGPRWVYAPMPESLDERNTLTLEAALAGVDIYNRPEFYRPLADGSEFLKNKALPLDALSRYNSEDEVKRVLAEYPSADAWLPLMSNVQPQVVLLQKEEGRVLAIVSLRPWS